MLSNRLKKTGILDLNFRLIDNSNLYNDLLIFRKKAYQHKYDYLLIEQDAFDNSSYNFLLTNQDDSEILAMCRITMCKEGVFEASSIFEQEISSLASKDYIQVNRVFVHEKYRNLNLHLFLFKELSNWVIQNLKEKKFLSVCEQKLLIIYKKLGVKVISEIKEVPSRNHKKYVLVEGEFSKIIRNINFNTYNKNGNFNRNYQQLKSSK